MIFLRLLGMTVLFASLSGCASVTGTRNQPVSVRTTCGGTAQVAGAACKLSNDKGEWHVNSTPGSVTIQKSYADVAVECEKSNAGKGASVFKSSANPNLFGNILVGGIVGFAIDSAGGAGYDYPQLMSVEVCDGVFKADVLDEAKKGASFQHLSNATNISVSLGCSANAENSIKTPWGAERYSFACLKRPPLHMECLYGCKQVSPF